METINSGSVKSILSFDVISKIDIIKINNKNITRYKINYIHITNDFKSLVTMSLKK